MKMTFQEIRIIATAPCIANQLRDVNTICRRSWYIAAHIWKINDFKIEVVPFIINFSTELTILQNGRKILTNTCSKNVCNLIYYTSSISQFNTFKDNSNLNSGHQNHKKEWKQEKKTFNIIKQITHRWEGGRADCYPEKFNVNRSNHPLSYVLFI